MTLGLVMQALVKLIDGFDMIAAWSCLQQHMILGAIALIGDEMASSVQFVTCCCTPFMQSVLSVLSLLSRVAFTGFYVSQPACMRMFYEIHSGVQ